MNNKVIAAAVAAVIVVAAIVLGSWYTVDQTERGVILRTGAVIGTAQPGLGFKVGADDRQRREDQRQDHHL